MRRLFSFSCISRLLGAVLLLAGVASAYDTLDTPGGLAAVPWPRTVADAGEIAFGLGLLVGFYPRLSWWLLVGCFITLLGVSFDSAIRGESSCGCFGRFHVKPWYTFSFDAAAVLALACVQPFGGQTLGRAGGGGRWAVYALLLVLVFAGLGASTYVDKARLGDDGEIIGQGDDVLLSPRTWVGRRFPLARYLDVGPALMEGRWALMFYHRECSACRTALPEFVGLAYHLANQDRATRLALIEVPRQGEAPSVPSREGLYLRGHLVSGERRWRIRTPAFVVLDSGTVTEAPDQIDGVYRALGVGAGEVAEQGGILLPDFRRIRRERFLREIACGPMALMRVLRAFNRPLGEDEAERLIDEAGEKGIDMLRLKELAEQHGLHGLGIAATPERLRQLGQRAIVLLDGVGFVPVLGFVRGGVIVAYPLASAGVLPDDLFAKSFGAEGKALLLSEEPLSPARLGLSTAGDKDQPRGPRLRLRRSILAVGRIHRKNWEASLMLENDGGAPLEIREIKTTCSCFSASVDRNTLQPGESTHLRARGTQDEMGGFTYAVEVKTNEREGKPMRIPVRGYLEKPVAFDPPTLLLRDVLPEEKAEAEVQVEFPRRLDFSSLRLTAPNEGPLAAELVRRDQGAALKLRWAGSKQPGTYRGEVSVRASDAQDAVASTLPVAVEVVPAITVYPPSIWIEDPAGDRWTRQLSIESKRELVGTPSLRWSDEAAGQAIQMEVTRENARSLRVQLSGTVPERRQPVALTIHIGDETVSVPFQFVRARE